MINKYPKLSEADDRRVKIPKSEHKLIVAKYKGGQGIRAIAREYKVDKRLIQFIIWPDRKERAKENRDWRKYYDTEKHKLYMRKHRAHKKEIQGEAVNKWRKVERKKYKNNGR